MWKILTFFLSACLCVSADSGPNNPVKTKKYVDWPVLAVVSCSIGLNNINWGYNGTFGGTSKGYKAICNYEPAFQSMVYCVNDLFEGWGKSQKEMTASTVKLSLVCIDYAGKNPINITRESILEALINGTSIIKSIYNASLPQYSPVYANFTKARDYAKAYHGLWYNRDLSNIYGGAICGYFLGVCVIAAISNLLRKTDLQKPLLKNKYWNYFRSYLTLPALFQRHAEEFRYFKVISGLVPTRMETVVVVGYFVLHAVLISVNLGIYADNVLFNPLSVMIAKYVGDRTGIMAFAHLPLIVLFATRNNILLWFTGLEYTTFMVFHKWVSRVMFLDAVIHSAAYTHYVILKDIWKDMHVYIPWKFGVAGTIFSSLMVLFAIRLLRKKYYETFLYTHIIFGALFFYSCWEHACQRGWVEWIYAAIAIWAVDRLVRVARLFVFGFPKGNFELLDDDLIRLTVPKSSKIWSAKPGQYAYIYFLHPIYFWQSHPFSVMDSLINENEVVLVFKPKDGLTRFVQNRVKATGGQMKMRVSLEGPYGIHSSLNHYESILLLVGGAGLPGPLGYAIKLAEKKLENRKNKMKLVISMRGETILNAFKEELKKLNDLGVDVELYDTSLIVAGPNSSRQSSENFAENKEDEKINESAQSLEESNLLSLVNHGRPKLDSIIKETVENSSSTCIFCCGPPPMVDTVRELTACYVRKYPQKPLEYFENYQNW